MGHYEALPTSEKASSPTNRQPQPRSRRLFLVFVSFCLLVFGSYRYMALFLQKLESVTRPADNADTSKFSVGYFVNWGIYARHFPPSLIPAKNLTHVLYAFANILPDTGEVVLSDTWSDTDIHYPGDSWNEPGNNLYGNFKAIYKLKQQNRHLKSQLSIGGWTYSPNFDPVVVDPARIAKFAQTAVKMVEDFGLDGLDIDYEFPADEAHAQGYVNLLKALRNGLDDHARSKGINYRFTLSIAAPCGPDNYNKLHVRDMDQYLDMWNLMAYDFSGPWDSKANNQANLFGGTFNGSQAVQFYIGQGVARSKIVLGLPLYGRSFLNTDGPGKPFSGVGPGSWESGVYDYRTLPLTGSQVSNNVGAVASWSYDANKREMISFDDVLVGTWKGSWIKKMGLRGSMFWELSGDKGSGPRPGMEPGEGKDEKPGASLIGAVKDAMGPLSTASNWLTYEMSSYDNMKHGMP